LHKKRAEEYTKTEATELRELADKHSWKKERKKERKNSVYHKNNNDTSCSGMQSFKNSTTHKKKKQLTLKWDSKRTSWY
jgi:hypothetical protein